MLDNRSSIEEAAPDYSGSLLLRKRPVGMLTTLMALSCSLLWAGQSVAVKIAVNEMPPFLVMGLRFLLALITISLVAFVLRIPLRVERRWLPWLLGHAVLLCIQTTLYTLGTDATQSVNSIVIINSFPFFTAIICHYCLPDFPFTWRAISGLVLAFTGLLVVFAPGLIENGLGNRWGDWLVLSAAVMMGVKITYVKSLLRHVSPIPVVFWTAVCAAPMLLLTSYALGEFASVEWHAQAITAIAYQGMAVSAVAVLMWTTLLSWHAPNDVTVFRMATPLLGMALGWLILKEPVSGSLIVGAVLIALGVYRVTR